MKLFDPDTTEYVWAEVTLDELWPFTCVHHENHESWSYVLERVEMGHGDRRVLIPKVLVDAWEKAMEDYRIASKAIWSYIESEKHDCN